MNGIDAYTLQEMPDDQRTFKRIVTWLVPGHRPAAQARVLRRRNRLWKVETFENVANIHDVPTAQRVRMEDVQTGYGSEYRVSELAYGVTIPKELFDPAQLPRRRTVRCGSRGNASRGTAQSADRWVRQASLTSRAHQAPSVNSSPRRLWSSTSS